MTDVASTGDSQRRILRACVLGAFLAWVVFLGMLIQDGGLLHRDTFGNFYDAQADSLLHGHWNVDPKEVAFEGFKINGKVYEYFGPVPAVVRMPIEAMTHRYHGRLTRLSLLLAETVLLVFAVRLVAVARRASRSRAPTGRLDLALCAMFVFAAGASSTLFLGGHSWVYHEALLWGAALTVASLTLLAGFIESRRTSTLIWSCILAGLALNTRAVTGAGALVALGLVGAMEVWRALRSREQRSGHVRPVAVIALGLLIPTICYVLVNQARFGSMFGLPLDKQIVAHIDAQRRIALAANHNSMFGVKFAPTQTLQALRPDALHPTRLFPFVDFPTKPSTVIGHAVFDTRDPTSSITSSEPALFLWALAGLATLLWARLRRRSPGLRGWGLICGGAAVSCAGFLSINFVANRYFTDVLPFLLIAGAVGVDATIRVVRRIGSGPAGFAARLTAVAGTAVLVLFGGWVNASLGLQYHEVIAAGASSSSRARWLSLQLRINNVMGGTGVTPGASVFHQLPAESYRGQIAVLGACEALYRSNGDQWNLLEGDSSITVRLTGSIPAPEVGKSAVIAEKAIDGGAVRLAWHNLDENKYRVDVVRTVGGHDVTVVSSDPFPWSGPLVGPLTVVMDANTGEVAVSNRTQTFFDWFTSMPTGSIVPGRPLRAEPLSTSVCRRVAT